MNRRYAFIALLTTTAVAVAAMSVVRRHGSTPSPITPVTAATLAASRRAVVDATTEIVLDRGEMARLMEAMQTLPRTSDRSAFDVHARASALHADARAALTFVQGKLANEFYPGVLRGPSGALQAGAGNDLDKSALLAALLTDMKKEVRFARCTLSAAAARTRLEDYWAVARRPDEDVNVTPSLKAALIQSGIPDTRAAALATQRESARQTLERLISDTARADLEVVRSAMVASRIQPRRTADSERVIEESRTHYWVQVHEAGTWEDYDGSARAGSQPPCTASETFTELPPEVYQTITVSVRNEYIDAEALQSETVLTQRFRTSDLYGQVLTVSNIGLADEGGLLQSTHGFDKFVPFLSAGDEVFSGTEYRPVAKAAPGAGGMFDAFGGAVSGAGPDHVLAAQWLDFLLEAPGRRLLVTRPLVDFVEPAERAAKVIHTTPSPAIVTLALAQGAAIAVSAGRIHPIAAMETAYRELDPQAVGRVFDQQADLATPEVSADWATVGDRLLGAKALTYAAVAERLLHTATADANVRLVRDQPMLVITNLAIRQTDAGGPVLVEPSVDIRHSRIAALVRAGGDPQAAFWANVLQGLTDGAMEHHLALMAARPASRPESSASKSTDTSLILNLAKDQGIEIRAEAGTAAQQILLGPLASAGGRRLAPEITDAMAIVVPARPPSVHDQPRLGLWSVDLETGHLVSLLDTGLRGQNNVEDRLNRLVNFLQQQVRRCVQRAAAGLTAMSRCRAMFDMWGAAVNDLMQATGNSLRVAVTDGEFMGWMGL